MKNSNNRNQFETQRFYKITFVQCYLMRDCNMCLPATANRPVTFNYGDRIIGLGSGQYEIGSSMIDKSMKGQFRTDQLEFCRLDKPMMCNDDGVDCAIQFL